MHPDNSTIRDFLASALRDATESWPAEWCDPALIEAIGDAAVFHGIAGLLVDQRPSLDDWPAALADRLREQARAQAMWELRHHQLLADLLPELANGGAPALVLKGSAIAYDLYGRPAARSRGDSDVLVHRDQQSTARAVLHSLGYRRHGFLDGLDDELSQQEVWTMPCDDGSSHGIDLHWEVLNAQSLKHVLPVADCFANSRALPRLSPAARTLDRPRFLLHTCVHRAMHRTAPYFVDGKPHYDEGRLVWSSDIALLAQALTVGEWTQFVQLAIDRGVAAACLTGLHSAVTNFGATIPAQVIAELQHAGNDTYLSDSALRRAWRDLRSVSGGGARLRYLRGRLLPAPGFMRAKYPTMSRAPLIVLYARRLAESLRR
jgi:hypothetical protein